MIQHFHHSNLDNGSDESSQDHTPDQTDDLSRYHSPDHNQYSQSYIDDPETYRSYHLTTHQKDSHQLFPQYHHIDDINQQDTDLYQQIIDNWEESDYSVETSDYHPWENFDIHHADTTNIIGNPNHDMQFWYHPDWEFACGVAVQKFVLESISDRHFSESELTQEAIDKSGYQLDKGMALGRVGDILEVAGVHVTHEYNCSLSDLERKLKEGEKVIVGVNEGEILMSNQRLSDYRGIPVSQGANHVVQVIGIDRSDPEHEKIILNDPAVDFGRGLMVPKERFMTAWQAGRCYAIVTDNQSKVDANVNY